MKYKLISRIDVLKSVSSFYSVLNSSSDYFEKDIGLSDIDVNEVDSKERAVKLIVRGIRQDLFDDLRSQHTEIKEKANDVMKVTAVTVSSIINEFLELGLIEKSGLNLFLYKPTKAGYEYMINQEKVKEFEEERKDDKTWKRVMEYSKGILLPIILNILGFVAGFLMGK